jgi:hypothetical protein
LASLTALKRLAYGGPASWSWPAGSIDLYCPSLEYLCLAGDNYLMRTFLSSNGMLSLQSSLTWLKLSPAARELEDKIDFAPLQHIALSLRSIEVNDVFLFDFAAVANILHFPNLERCRIVTEKGTNEKAPIEECLPIFAAATYMRVGNASRKKKKRKKKEEKNKYQPYKKLVS